MGVWIAGVRYEVNTEAELLALIAKVTAPVEAHAA